MRFRGQPLSVEIYDLDARRWNACDVMPAILKDSAASPWFNTAAISKILYIVEQVSGVTYFFDPMSRIWSELLDLRHNKNIFFSVIGIFGVNLVLVGLVGNSENVKDVKVWEVKGKSFDILKEIAIMSKELVEKLKGEDASLNSIKISSIGEYD
ncbi:hypothetical protein J1N35_015211 [Gossypium stocksii]|uniref:Uncharacterized protein n=1 Tax=Gossypium stocksii TaxID=47602 RepID=A0A9D3VVR5_9ROSI|nr:hypothetical protein J1N35_015211 [Gossypium stocksii]